MLNLPQIRIETLLDFLSLKVEIGLYFLLQLILLLVLKVLIVLHVVVSDHFLMVKLSNYQTHVDRIDRLVDLKVNYLVKFLLEATILLILV